MTWGDSEIKFETPLVTHIQNWSKRYTSAQKLDAIDGKGIFSDSYYCPAPGAAIYWSPHHTRKLITTQGMYVDENNFRYHEYDLYCEAEMVSFLTRVYRYQLSRASHLVLSKMMDAWNAWLDISPVTFTSLSIMMPLTAARYIHTETVKPFRLRLVSSVRRAEESIGVAGHDFSDDLAQRCYGLCNSTGLLPRIGFSNFLKVVEDLLRDVHRNRDLSNVDKEALKDALTTAAAAEASLLMKMTLLVRRASTRFRNRHTRSLLSLLPTDSINVSRESKLAGIAEIKRLRGLALD